MRARLRSSDEMAEKTGGLAEQGGILLTRLLQTALP
jgi:hypothetical protein